MAINRIVIILFILITGFTASFYGGNISYALFYMALSIPAVSFLYTLYVYARFKLYQTIGKRTVIKGEATEYIFQLANEDVLSFENIKVNFFSDKSKILGSQEEIEYSLLPGEKQSMETLICCNYRGEYNVGAKTVTITDFLYLFSVTYPVFSKMKVTVLPRIVNLSNLRILSANSDSKGRLKRIKEEEEEADLEVRTYIPGDNRKRIHWKASARKQELLTRKYTSIPKIGVTIFMDLANVWEDELSKIIVEDKIIEGTIAIADYCRRKSIPCMVYFDQGGIKRNRIYNQTEFDSLYRQCVDIRFAADKPVEQVVNQLMESGELLSLGYQNQSVIITHFISEELYKTVLRLLSSGNECSLIYIAERYTIDTEHLIRLIQDAGANITILNHTDEICDLF